MLHLKFNRSATEVVLPDEIQTWCEEFASGMMDAAELAHLAACLFSLQFRPHDYVLEIGSYIGQTAAFTAKVVRYLQADIPVVAIDPFERFRGRPWNPSGSYSKYLETIERHRVGDRCFPIVAFSHQVAEIVSDNVALLVIDGDHSYEAVKSDLRLFTPKVRPGGFVFCDDYTVEPYEGVVRAIDEHFRENRSFDLVHTSWFHVAQKRRRRRPLQILNPHSAIPRPPAPSPAP